MPYFYVYRITDHSNGKHYIGSRRSVVPPRSDLGHRYFTSSKTFRPIFQSGPSERFKIKIVSLHDTYKDACLKEHRLLRRVDALRGDRFYNLVVFSDHSIDVRFTDEVLQKLRDSHLGNTSKRGTKLSDESKRRISEVQKGRKISDETRQKMSLAHKGKPKSDETRERMRIAFKGRVITTEQRMKISNTLRGRNVRAESRERAMIDGPL